MGTVQVIGMSMNSLSILQMIQVSDSLFPIGTYTLSNGLETFVCKGKLKSEQDLTEYLESYMEILPYNDLGTMILAYDHSQEEDYIWKLDEYSMALKNPMEIRSGTRKLCSRFLKTFEKIAVYHKLQQYGEWIENGRCQGNHAIAVGLYAKEIGLTREVAASIYTYSLLSAIITNAVKIIPLSQMSGQKILNEKLDKIEECIAEGTKIQMEDLGVGGTEFDIEAMNHEMLYSRLYMS